MKRKCLAIGIILLFGGTCIIPVIAQDTKKPLPSSRGTWLYVGGSGPGNYTRIQDAIDNASDGDTVYVFDESSPYNESIIITRKIQLTGENRTTTILQPCNASSNTTTICADSVTIQNLWIKNSGKFSDTFCIIERMYNNSRILNNVISDGGCGILIKNDNPEYNNNHLISYNKITSCRFGFISYFSNNNVLSNNTFIDNVDPMTINACTNNTICYNYFNNNSYSIVLNHNRNTSVYLNTINNSHIGIFLFGRYWWYDENPIPNNYIIRNNTITQGGLGIRVDTTSSVEISYNNVCNNLHHGVYIFDSSDINFHYNNLETNGLSGIYLFNSTNTSITQNNIIEKKLLFFYFEAIPPINQIIFFENFWGNLWPMKIIFGTIGHPSIWSFKRLNIKFDIKAAKEPYDIPRVS